MEYLSKDIRKRFFFLEKSKGLQNKIHEAIRSSMVANNRINIYTLKY